MIGLVCKRIHKDRVIDRNFIHFKVMKLVFESTMQVHQVARLDHKQL